LGDSVDTFNRFALGRECGVIPVGNAEMGPSFPHAYGRAEIAEKKVAALTTFVRLGMVDLPQQPSDDAHAAKLFRSVGCAVCHKPEWHGTDLCFHRLGPQLLRVKGKQTDGLQLITRRLVGRRSHYLHDGSAATIHDAVLRHSAAEAGGRFEADKVVENYLALSEDDRKALGAYVEAGLGFTPPER
jgi:CxxC motif-containing protein (DUF1111 family)